MFPPHTLAPAAAADLSTETFSFPTLLFERIECRMEPRDRLLTFVPPVLFRQDSKGSSAVSR